MTLTFQQRVKRSLQVTIVLQIGMVILLGWIQYNGNVSQRDAQVKACQGSKPARAKQATVLEKQAKADHITSTSKGVPAKVKPGIKDKGDAEASAARALRLLNGVPCEEKYPAPSLLPFP